MELQCVLHFCASKRSCSARTFLSFPFLSFPFVQQPTDRYLSAQPMLLCRPLRRKPQAISPLHPQPSRSEVAACCTGLRLSKPLWIRLSLCAVHLPVGLAPCRLPQTAAARATPSLAAAAAPPLASCRAPNGTAVSVAKPGQVRPFQLSSAVAAALWPYRERRRLRRRPTYHRLELVLASDKSRNLLGAQHGSTNHESEQGLHVPCTCRMHAFERCFWCRLVSARESAPESPMSRTQEWRNADVAAVSE